MTGTRGAARRHRSLDTTRTADPNDEIQRDFWLRHMRIGFGLFLGETFMVMVYLGITPHERHRTILWAMAGVWLASALINLMLAPHLASRHWRTHFSAAWTYLSVAAVALFAVLDGGIDSPIIFLLFLPVSYAALAFTPRVAAGCGVITVAAAAFVTATDSHVGLTGDDALVLFGVLAGVSVLSVAGSVNRVRREQRERRLSDRVAELAAVDGLTGCAVHRVFYERLEQEIGRALRQGSPLSLMLIDIDRFKSINDTYGHLVGDHVLTDIGAVLHAHTRSFDVVGRLGGDEFAVLMPGTEPSAAVVLAQRIRLEASVTTEVAVTLSIGVSGLDPSAPTTERMVDDADFALYEVKGSGRDGVAVRFSEQVGPVNRPEEAPTP